jgi:circadian clock protein KaiB
MNIKQELSSSLGTSEKNEVSEIAGFRLYIKGMYPDSVKALIVIKTICERYLPGRSCLEIVDTLRDPERALADGIINIPTLIKLSPSPSIKISNEIEDPEKVLTIFGLKSASLETNASM